MIPILAAVLVLAQYQTPDDMIIKDLKIDSVKARAMQDCLRAKKCPKDLGDKVVCYEPKGGVTSRWYLECSQPESRR
jgi:hypothetical protein